MGAFDPSTFAPREPAPHCGKHRYADKKAALSAINFRMRDHRQKRGKTKHLRAYPCPDCHGWHITHRAGFTVNRRRAAFLRAQREQRHTSDD